MIHACFNMNCCYQHPFTGECNNPWYYPQLPDAACHEPENYDDEDDDEPAED